MTEQLTHKHDACHTCAWSGWSSRSSSHSLLLVVASITNAAAVAGAGESICHEEDRDSTKIMTLTHTHLTFVYDSCKLPDSVMEV